MKNTWDKLNTGDQAPRRLFNPRAWNISILDVVAMAAFAWTGALLIVAAVQTTNQAKLAAHYPLTIGISAGLHVAAAGICVLRTRKPLVFSALAATILVAYAVLQQLSTEWLGIPTLMLLAPLVVGTLAWRESNLWLTIAFLAGCAGSFFSPSMLVTPTPPAEWATHVLVLVVALLIGRLVKAGNAKAENHRQRLATEAVSTERERIAADLHDEVGHGLTIVIVQARAAALMVNSDPALAKQALERIAKAASQTLAATRQTVEVLHEDAPPRPAITKTTGIRALLETMMESGNIKLTALDPVQVEAETSGWTPANRTALERVMTEGCTNALKHGREDKPVSIKISADPVHAEVEITNTTKPSAPNHREGTGLVFLRTRVRSVGGKIESTDADGIFTLSASIPSGREQ